LDWVTAFIAKKSLFDIPVFGRLMKYYYCVPIDRKNREQAIQKLNIDCKKVLSNF